jgi:hypothetical protein
VLRLTGTGHGERCARRGPLRATFVSITCLLRGLSLFFRASPGTPLRVLCIVALDTIRVLRSSPPLSRQERHDLATLLDFQACTNAVWDRKHLCLAEYQALRQRLENAGLGVWVEAYLSRLGELEARRPPIGGDRHRFDDVRLYRESVVRLSLATLIAMTSKAGSLEDAIRSTYCESDVATLFQLAMQCQIIDDVLDYSEDLSAGLPSFLTASASLPEAMALTAEAARSYAARPGRPAGRSVLPLEAALYVLTTATKFVVAVVRRREPCLAE